MGRGEFIYIPLLVRLHCLLPSDALRYCRSCRCGPPAHCARRPIASPALARCGVSGMVPGQKCACEDGYADQLAPARRAAPVLRMSAGDRPPWRAPLPPPPEPHPGGGCNGASACDDIIDFLSEVGEVVRAWGPEFLCSVFCVCAPHARGPGAIPNRGQVGSSLGLVSVAFGTLVQRRGCRLVEDGPPELLEIGSFQAIDRHPRPALLRNKSRGRTFLPPALRNEHWSRRLCATRGEACAELGRFRVCLVI